MSAPNTTLQASKGTGALQMGSVSRAKSPKKSKVALTALAVIALLVVAGLLAMHFTLGCNAAGFQKLWGIMQAKHQFSLNTLALMGGGTAAGTLAVIALVSRATRNKDTSSSCCSKSQVSRRDPLYNMDDETDAAAHPQVDRGDNDLIADDGDKSHLFAGSILADGPSTRPASRSSSRGSTHDFGPIVADDLRGDL